MHSLGISLLILLNLIKNLEGPFIAANGFSSTPEKVIEIIEKTDGLVAFGHAFIAIPELPKRRC